MAKYVGKRIVPKHCGYWDRTQAYEMECIVYDQASGNSYISRKAVPAGTLLSQTDYWALCSDFNEQMYMLNQHVTQSEAESGQTMTPQKLRSKRITMLRRLRSNQTRQQRKPKSITAWRRLRPGRKRMCERLRMQMPITQRKMWTQGWMTMEKPGHPSAKHPRRSGMRG